MIVSFKNEDTHRFYKGEEIRRFRSVNRELALKRLDYLNAAKTLSDIPPFKSFHLHPLIGDRKGQWSISINGPWRKCFIFHDGNAFDVEIVGSH